MPVRRRAERGGLAGTVFIGVVVLLFLLFVLFLLFLLLLSVLLFLS